MTLCRLLLITEWLQQLSHEGLSCCVLFLTMSNVILSTIIHHIWWVFPFFLFWPMMTLRRLVVMMEMTATTQGLKLLLFPYCFCFMFLSLISLYTISWLMMIYVFSILAVVCNLTIKHIFLFISKII